MVPSGELELTKMLLCHGFTYLAESPWFHCLVTKASFGLATLSIHYREEVRDLEGLPCPPRLPTHDWKRIQSLGTLIAIF